MGEITIQVKQNPGVIDVNFDELEKALDATLAEYRGALFSEDTKDIAKKELAGLRKQKKELDNSRKSIKKEWMRPYEEFETRAKSLLAKFDEPINLIDKQVKEFDEKRKQERQKNIQTVYKELVGDVAEYLPLSKIYDTKWENVSTSMKSIKDSISELVRSTQAAVRVIGSMQSDATEKALTLYKDTLDMSKAITYINDYERQKAEIMRKEEERRKAEEERKRQAEIERIRFEERQHIREEERIRNEAKQEVVSEIKKVDEVEAAPLSSAESLKVIYTVVATLDEIQEIEMALTSLGVYFERKDV